MQDTIVRGSNTIRSLRSYLSSLNLSVSNLCISDIFRVGTNVINSVTRVGIIVEKDVLSYRKELNNKSVSGVLPDIHYRTSETGSFIRHIRRYDPCGMEESASRGVCAAAFSIPKTGGRAGAADENHFEKISLGV